MNTLIVPYVGEYPLRVMQAITEDAPWFDWEPSGHPLNEGEVTAYWHLLCQMWNKAGTYQDDLMVVEHDIVIHDQVFEQFEVCKEPVCAFAYWISGSYGFGLGCTRFRNELIKEYPDLMASAGHLTDDGLPVIGHWKRMDTRVYAYLEKQGIKPHIHMPPVKHLHDYPMQEPE